MDNKNKGANYIIALSCTLVALIIVGVKYVYYFDLNDDVLMKDIISGVYSGKPEFYNIQMQFSMSALFGILYRLYAVIPWYGLFLVVTQYICIAIIVSQTINLFDIKITERTALIVKAFVGISETALLVVLMLWHLVNVQYTITVAFIASAALMLILNLDKELEIKAFIVKAIPIFLLLTIGFSLRSEMMLLCMPFVGLAGIYKWSFEDKAFEKRVITKYVCSLLIIVALMGVVALINKVAYSKTGWNTFSDLFDARTQLYDYQIIPQYDGNEDFYKGIGLEKSEAYLFENYNYGLDDEITNTSMWKVVDYAASLRNEDMSFGERLFVKLRLYIYEFTHGKNSVGSDYPYNYVAIIFYLLVIAVIVGSKDYMSIWKPLILFGGRSLIWLYILLGDRSPDRITHSLYFIEIVLLIGLLVSLINEYYKSEKLIDKAVVVQWILIGIVGLLYFGSLVKGCVYSLNIDQSIRTETIEPYTELYQYMALNEDKYYLVDVYSTVSYSEGIFGRERLISKANSELMGGWFYGSPIQKMKLHKVGFEGMEEAILDENVYFVKRKEREADFLTNYFNEKNIDTDLSLVDTVAGEFEIYELDRK